MVGSAGTIEGRQAYILSQLSNEADLEWPLNTRLRRHDRSYEPC